MPATLVDDASVSRPPFDVITFPLATLSTYEERAEDGGENPGHFGLVRDIVGPVLS
ncbi:MAG: hypothetical protein OXC91_13995 [Rhodobacteraceae bacterium]|nr:hypothetical protein [Paracoccaceae bacterium]